MLLLHSAQYLLARGLPGLINFAALAVYTRLLAPEEFGRYALVLAGIGLANVFVFQWLRLVLARFLLANSDDPQPFLAGVLAQFLVLSLSVSGIGLVLALLWSDPVWQRLLALAVPLLLTQAAFELTLTLASANLKPGRYGKLLGSKAVVGLSVGSLLAWLGLGAAAPVTGLIVAHAVALLLFGCLGWRGIAPRWPAAAELRKQLAYGLPLTITFALAWVVAGSDRLLLAWLLDESAVGVYAAGYDLAFQSLTLALAVINTAAYPLAVAALESHGAEQAKQQVQRNGELIIATALGGAAALIALAPLVVALIVGEAYRAEALLILPWVAAASALAGIKAYHFDIAFHLGSDSRWLVMTGAVAAVSNVGLNLLLIPAYGILGAAWGTLGAYAIAFLASAALGRQVFPMPDALPLLLKGGFVALATGSAAWLGLSVDERFWLGLTAGLFMGVGGALSAMLLMDVCGTRGTALKVWRMCLTKIAC